MDKSENIFGSKSLTPEQRIRKRRVLHKSFREDFADHSPRCDCYDCRKMRKRGQRTVYTRSQLRQRAKDKEEIEERYSEYLEAPEREDDLCKAGGWLSGSKRRS